MRTATAVAPVRPIPLTVIPVQWPDTSLARVEILREPWSLVKHEHCPACGQQGGIWAAGLAREQQNETWRLCVGCGTAYQFAVLPRDTGRGFLAVILEQLRSSLGLGRPLALLK